MSPDRTKASSNKWLQRALEGSGTKIKGWRARRPIQPPGLAMSPPRYRHELRPARFRYLFIGLACLVVFSLRAGEKDLIPMSIPRDDHDPLYIERQTIQRTGAIVSFRYVLDVPILGDAGGVQRFRSNEVEGTIDCARRTFRTGTVTAYSGVAATGDATGGYTPKPGESPPSAVDERKGSTSGYLYRYLCIQHPDIVGSRAR